MIKVELSYILEQLTHSIFPYLGINFEHQNFFVY